MTSHPWRVVARTPAPKPLASKRASYSAAVRSRAPNMTSMCRSTRWTSRSSSKPRSGESRTCSTIQSRADVAHGGADRPEDPDGLAVGPVVQDVGEHVDVAASGDGGEEVGRLALRAVAEAGVGEVRLRLRGHVGTVGDDASHAWGGGEQPGEHGAASAADVDDQVGRGKVLRGEDGRDLVRPAPGHGTR